MNKQGSRKTKSKNITITTTKNTQTLHTITSKLLSLAYFT